MRAISLIDHLEFDFNGNVLRNALTLRDVDNDGDYELIVANEKGDVVIFKGNEKWQTITNLGFVSCLGVGDIFNRNKNSLVIITGDGWCYIYNSPDKVECSNDEGIDTVDGQILSGESFETQSEATSVTLENAQEKEKKKSFFKNHLQRVHVQRIPANAKYILLDDIDGDGCIEMVLGLTDRVVRSYRWFDPLVNKPARNNGKSLDSKDTISKLVGLNKWECARQIGSVTLHHNSENRPSLLIAQPGGTFMRIRYQTEEVVDLSDSSNSISEFLTGASIDYQILGLSRMRNQLISTEIVGDLKTKVSKDKKGSPYAVATLDGTIMLVQDEIILWAIAVDHQIFALTKLDVTGDGTDDLVACSWDGHTYILDQDKNSVRFQLGQSVQAFDSGYYTLTPGEPPVTCFVYITFHNKILLYYNIPLIEIICKRFSPDIEKFDEIIIGENRVEKAKVIESLSRNDKSKLVEYLLYGLKS